MLNGQARSAVLIVCILVGAAATGFGDEADRLIVSGLAGSTRNATTMVEPSAQQGETGDHGKIIYGEDNRRDAYDYHDQAWALLTLDHSVALIAPADIDASNPADVQILGPTLGADQQLCADQRFLNQPTASLCSGILIEPDRVLTAGHCIRDQVDCNNTRFVFNFAMADSTELMTITSEDVYSCQQILARQDTDTLDFAIIELDRPASGHTPATVSWAARPVPADAALVVSGHPSGIPLKIADGA